MDDQTRRECAEIERRLGELLDRGTVEEIADFAASRLPWLIDKVRELSNVTRAA